MPSHDGETEIIMRLDRFLAECGFGTRSEVKKLIRTGAVSINGEQAKKADLSVDTDSDRVTVSGSCVQYKKYVYLMLNKPNGYISATRDGRLPTVLSLVPDEYRHFSLHPVGRLDIDTEGLLILTNDGGLSHRLLSPRSHVPKKYLAELDRKPDSSDISAFAEGVTLDDGYHTLPAELQPRDGCFAEVTIHEGKFHQVKRMFEAVGKKVVYLKRIKMNALPLDESLSKGEMRELTETELELLRGKL